MYSEIEKTPRNLLVCEKSNFDNEKARISSHVEQHHFNYKISLLLPECASFPEHLDDVINSFSKFYLVRNLPLYKLVDPAFVDLAVQRGSTVGLSYKTRIDEDNCFALLPNGKLIMAVDKDTYELLGIEGKPSQFNQRPTRRYVVSVDLKGARGHQRLLTALRDRLPLQSDFLLATAGAEEGTALMELLSGCEWSEQTPQVNRQALKLACPAVSGTHDPHDLLEWLGAVDAGISCQDHSDSSQGQFLSSYEGPGAQKATPAVSCSISGFLRSQDIYRLLEELRHFVAVAGRGSWVGLTVHGFMDSPVSWGEAEHGFLQGGENFYTILLLQNHDYWIYMGTGSHDACPP